MKTALLAVLLLSINAGARGGESVSASMQVSGSFAQGHSFQFIVATDGKSVLTVEGQKEPAKKSLQIPPAKLNELRELLQRERFFELGSSYGDNVPDGSTTTITAHLGDQTKTVKLQFFRHEDPLLPEIRRAVRVSIFLRGLFDNPDAVDLRRYGEMMLHDPPK